MLIPSGEHVDVAAKGFDHGEVADEGDKVEGGVGMRSEDDDERQKGKGRAESKGPEEDIVNLCELDTLEIVDADKFMELIGALHCKETEVHHAEFCSVDFVVDCPMEGSLLYAEIEGKAKSDFGDSRIDSSEIDFSNNSIVNLEKLDLESCLAEGKTASIPEETDIETAHPCRMTIGDYVGTYHGSCPSEDQADVKDGNLKGKIDEYLPAFSIYKNIDTSMSYEGYQCHDPMYPDVTFAYTGYVSSHKTENNLKDPELETFQPEVASARLERTEIGMPSSIKVQVGQNVEVYEDQVISSVELDDNKIEYVFIEEISCYDMFQGLEPGNLIDVVDDENSELLTASNRCTDSFKKEDDECNYESERAFALNVSGVDNHVEFEGIEEGVLQMDTDGQPEVITDVYEELTLALRIYGPPETQENQESEKCNESNVTDCRNHGFPCDKTLTDDVVGRCCKAAAREDDSQIYISVGNKEKEFFEPNENIEETELKWDLYAAQKAYHVNASVLDEKILATGYSKKIRPTEAEKNQDGKNNNEVTVIDDGTCDFPREKTWIDHDTFGKTTENSSQDIILVNRELTCFIEEHENMEETEFRQERDLSEKANIVHASVLDEISTDANNSSELNHLHQSRNSQESAIVVAVRINNHSVHVDKGSKLGNIRTGSGCSRIQEALHYRIGQDGVTNHDPECPAIEKHAASPMDVQHQNSVASEKSNSNEHSSVAFAIHHRLSKEEIDEIQQQLDSTFKAPYALIESFSRSDCIEGRNGSFTETSIASLEDLQGDAARKPAKSSFNSCRGERTQTNSETEIEPINRAISEHENQVGEKQDDIITDTVDLSPPEGPHTPLKNLLVEANLASKIKGPNAQDWETSLEVNGIQLSVQGTNTSATTAQPVAKRLVYKEWDSPARLPSNKNPKVKARGKSQWVPFMCCSYVS